MWNTREEFSEEYCVIVVKRVEFEKRGRLNYVHQNLSEGNVP